MDITTAQIAAELARTLYKMKLISYDELDKTVNKLQIWVWQHETKAP